jgi:hypothetical protein
VPLDPAYKAGLAGHVPVKGSSKEHTSLNTLPVVSFDPLIMRRRTK